MYVRTWNTTTKDSDAKTINKVSLVECGSAGDFANQGALSIVFNNLNGVLSSIVFKDANELGDFIRAATELLDKNAKEVSKVIYKQY